MFYLPESWVKKKENAKVIREILEQVSTTDLRMEGSPTTEDLVRQLLDIGEPIVAEKFKNGEISFPN